ncbi:MAG TPA: copper homeostasis periplasmic binding protein CopC [Burkholderiaceae bacterium]
MNLKRILALSAMCCGFAIAGHALAHAHPKSMVPAADAAVASPAEVSMTFSEALEAAFSSLTVQDAAGHAVAGGKTEFDSAARTTMHMSLPALAPGVYTVTWVAVARDGHRSSGSYRFTVK